MVTMIQKKPTTQKKPIQKPNQKQKLKPKPKSAPPPPPSKKPKKEEENNNSSVDEKGNPFPIENPEGGDPTCIGGYKIDYDFDIFDPINPLFRCIPSLKDPSDGFAGKMLDMANNPSSGVINDITNMNPIGGAVNSRRKNMRIRRRHRTRRRHHTRRRHRNH
jgi:outer membrane biosynthesis protein TonB